MAGEMERLAIRAASRSIFVAARIAAYQQRFTLDDHALAAYLGCTLAHLTQLRLCTNPRPNHFDQDVRRIADYTRVKTDALALLLRSEA